MPDELCQVKELHYPSGQVKSRSCYEEGRLHGLSEFFASNGELLSVSCFYRGRAQGASKQFYQGGALYAQKQYESGLLHGLQEYFYENGDKKTVLTYEKGDLHGEVVLFWPERKIKRRCFYARGIKTGLDILYSEEGVVLDEGEFILGQPCGVHRRRYPNGQPLEEKRYHQEGGADHLTWDEGGRPTYEALILARGCFRETRWCWPEGKKKVREGVVDGQHVRWD